MWEDCGKPTASLSGSEVVVVFGETTTRESFPWHAAIFRSNGPGTPYYFYCGGSLVTPSNKGFLIVTAGATTSLTLIFQLCCDHLEVFFTDDVDFLVLYL